MGINDSHNNFSNVNGPDNLVSYITSMPVGH